MKTKDYILLVSIILTVAIATSTMFLMDPPVKGIDRLKVIVAFLAFTWLFGLTIFIFLKIFIGIINFFRNLKND